MKSTTVALDTGATFNVLTTFVDLGLSQRVTGSVPIVKNVGFTIQALDTWLLTAEHPDGILSGRLILSNETPPILSPSGFGGFAKVGCSLTIPVEDDGRPWRVRFITPAPLTAPGLYTISYGVEIILP